MAFELLVKANHRIKLETNALIVTTNYIRFGPEFTKFLNGNNFCEIYIDESEMKLGFKPTQLATTGYTLSPNDKQTALCLNSASVIAKIKAHRFSCGIYVGKVINNMIVVTKK